MEHRQRGGDAGGVRPAGMHAVEANARVLLRPVLGLRHQRPLGPGVGLGAVEALVLEFHVVQVQRLQVQTAAGHVHHAPLAPLQGGQKLLGEQVRRQQVDRQGALGAFGGQVALIEQRAGVVDQAVHFRSQGVNTGGRQAHFLEP